MLQSDSELNTVSGSKKQTVCSPHMRQSHSVTRQSRSIFIIGRECGKCHNLQQLQQNIISGSSWFLLNQWIQMNWLLNNPVVSPLSLSFSLLNAGVDLTRAQSDLHRSAAAASASAAAASIASIRDRTSEARTRCGLRAPGSGLRAPGQTSTGLLWQGEPPGEMLPQAPQRRRAHTGVKPAVGSR